MRLPPPQKTHTHTHNYWNTEKNGQSPRLAAWQSEGRGGTVLLAVTGEMVLKLGGLWYQLFSDVWKFLHFIFSLSPPLMMDIWLVSPLGHCQSCCCNICTPLLCLIVSSFCLCIYLGMTGLLPRMILCLSFERSSHDDHSILHSQKQWVWVCPTTPVVDSLSIVFLSNVECPWNLVQPLGLCTY